MKKLVLAFALPALPAFAHGAGMPHAHPGEATWFVAAALVAGVALSGAVLRRAVKVRK